MNSLFKLFNYDNNIIYIYITAAATKASIMANALNYAKSQPKCDMHACSNFVEGSVCMNYLELEQNQNMQYTETLASQCFGMNRNMNSMVRF